MTVSPGTPTFTPPAYSVPALAAGSVAIGATVTTVKLENTSASARTNAPFRFGQVFKAGDLAPSAFLVGKIAGQADVPLQFNPLATHPDGSVRHAMISAVLPSLSAGATVAMALVRSSTGASTAAIAPGLFSSLAASVALDFAGVAYTANAKPAITALTSSAARIAGAIATEYNVALAPVSAGGVPHPDLEVRFDVVYFPGANAYKIDVTFEHTHAFSTTGDLTYSGTIQIGGATAYTLPNPLTHFPHARWKRTYWINNAAPLVARPDRDYWIDSRAVVNYDRRVTVSEATLAAYETQAADQAFAPMGNGIFTRAMGTTGGRPDIGLLPGYAAGTVLSMDKRAITLTKAGGDIAGSWGIHVRDTSNGPGRGMPMSCVNWPYATGNPNAVVVNPDTGQNELIPFPATSSQLTSDDAHTPNFAYLPYLMTGDLFYLEEMQFWSNGIFNNPMYRQKERGLIQLTQVRAQAWSLRGVMECAAFTPDAHPLKSHFKYWADSNIANYNTIYTNNPNATPLGCVNAGSDDTPYSIGGKSRNGVGLFQDDFFTSAVGHAVELGFASALPLLRWKAKFQIGRMIAPGVCYITSCPISLRIKDDVGSTTTYATLAECFTQSVGNYMGSEVGYYTQAIHDAACGSQAQLDLLNVGRVQPSNPFVRGAILGYATTTEGYPSNLQPGLALAVDSGYPDGDLAWDLFDGRTTQPDYSTSPQFAVVPRGDVAPATPTEPTPPATPTEPTPPATPTPSKDTMKYNSVKTTTTSTGIGDITTSATAARHSRPLADIPTGKVVTLRIEDPDGEDWELSMCTIKGPTSFSRDTVINGVNGPGVKIDFGAGTKDVYCVLTAEDVNDFLTATDGVSITDYLAANPGSTPTDADSILFMQGGSLVAEPLGSAATAFGKRWVNVVDEVIEIATTDAVTLDRTVHNRRRIDLYAVAPVKAPDLYASVGVGFRCNLKNFSGADVPLPGVTVRSTGASVLPAGASAEIYTSRGSVFAELIGSVGAAGGNTVTAPGQVTGLTAGIATDTTQPLTYAAPATGTAPFTYKIEYKRTADTAWTVAAPNATGTSYTVTGLTLSTSYDYRASAVNPAGTGAASTPVTKLTAAAAGAGGGGGTGSSAGVAPFTAYANGTFPRSLSAGQNDPNFLWSHVKQAVQGSGPTVTTVKGALSRSNTAIPTTALSETSTPEGNWIGTLSNYGGGDNWLVIGGTATDGTQYGGIKWTESARDYYYWLIVTDSAGATWYFVSSIPINIGTGNNGAGQYGSNMNFTQVQQ